MPKHYAWVAALVAGLMAPALAWTETTYTLQDCFQAAQRRSEDLASQQELIIQAEEHYQQAVGSILPSLSGSAAYSRQDTSGSQAASPEGSAVKLSATQPLFRGFREYAALRETRDLITAQTEARQGAGLQLYGDVSRGFYAVLAAQRDLEHIDAELKFFDQRIRDLQGRVRIGRSRPAEVLTVQAAQAQLKAQREQGNGQLAAAREVLAFLTGLAPDIVVNDTETVPSPVAGLEAYLARIDSRPDLRAAQKQVDSARENISIAQGGHWPSVDLTGDYYLERYGASGNGSWDAQIALTLPLFTGGVTSSRVRESESLARQSELALSRVRRSAAETVRSLYFSLQADLAQAIALEEALKLAEQNYRAVLRDYNLTLVTNLDVLQALTSYQDTARALDKARFAVKSGYQQLEAAAAKPDLPGERAKE